MRTRITLECTECKNRNYNMTKDKKNHPERMETKSTASSVNHTHCTKRQNKSLEGSGKMSEKSEKAQKTSWFKGLKAEFKKVVWPDKNTLAKQTTAVVSVSVLLER